ncbi:hypothetical protein J1605_022546 [Eschrichtius robustus]|uniref:Uncharacterized protein n=1 Tax=Eschrichtius robustus TaxID=9764 RepID=A0AB34H637_ESCRO|nr:hypothetical protein J1605_022546 [Eschrichtius robustus]
METRPQASHPPHTPSFPSGVGERRGGEERTPGSAGAGGLKTQPLGPGATLGQRLFSSDTGKAGFVCLGYRTSSRLDFGAPWAGLVGHHGLPGSHASGNPGLRDLEVSRVQGRAKSIRVTECPPGARHCALQACPAVLAGSRKPQTLDAWKPTEHQCLSKDCGAKSSVTSDHR